MFMILPGNRWEEKGGLMLNQQFNTIFQIIKLLSTCYLGKLGKGLSKI
jgi:hypothetical protein